MTNPTNPFSWQMPTATDLVTDLPADFEVFGQAVATSMADLLGGTTGQVLSKASNTNMDFTWVTSDDANAIQNAIVDAKGDLIAASAADTPARLAVGNNGETLVADSSATTGLRYQNNFAAGKNKIINGDFGIWQRGTSGFSLGDAYNADRFKFYRDGSGVTDAVTQQTFAPGTAPVAGYEGQFYFQYQATVAGTGATERALYTRLEDVRTFAGQTVTFSFFAKADAARTITLILRQNFGSGGSANVDTALTSQAVTTSWARYSATVALPSISGKTIGTSSFMQATLGFPVNVTETIQIWGVQLEAGSVATAFQTATGTIQGELALCQRYYFRNTAGDSSTHFSAAMGASSTTEVDHIMLFPVTMRVRPTSLDTSLILTYDGTSTYSSGTFALITGRSGVNTATVRYTHGSAALTQYRPYQIAANSNANAYIGFSAEL